MTDPKEKKGGNGKTKPINMNDIMNNMNNLLKANIQVFADLYAFMPPGMTININVVQKKLVLSGPEAPQMEYMGCLNISKPTMSFDKEMILTKAKSNG